MSKINCSIDLNKIDESKVKAHANGARYYDFDVQLMKQPDDWGKTHTVIQGQTKDERMAKAPKVYLGKGKEFIFGQSNATQQAASTNGQQQQAPEEDDLPF